MKKTVILLLVLAMLLGMAACSGGAGKETNGQMDAPQTSGADGAGTAKEIVDELGKVRYLDKKLEYTDDGKQIVKIYYCLDQFDESTQDELFSVQDEVAYLNETRDDVHLELLGYSDSQSNLAKQISDVETAIAMEPDVILIKPVDSVGIIPSLQAVYEAGIYVIETTGCDTDYVDVHWQGLDEITIGRKLAAHVREYLEANPDVNFKGGLIWGAPEQVEQLKRLTGFKELAEEMPDRFEIVAEQYGMWETAESQNIMEDWLQAYPEMNFIATAADQMTLGAVNAIKGANKLDDFYIVSCNGNQHDLNIMGAGEEEVFAGFITSESCGKAVDCAVDICTGKLAGQDSHISNADGATYICTPDKLEEYKKLKGITD